MYIAKRNSIIRIRIKPVNDLCKPIEENIIGKENAIKYNTRPLFNWALYTCPRPGNIKDKNAALNPVIAELKEKCDIIVLLSHSGYDTDIEFAKNYQDIDLIIGGHSQTLLKDASHIYDTYIVQAGKAGYRIGVLKLKIENSKIEQVENKLILLNKKIKNHQIIMKIIDEYKNKIKY